MTIALSLLGLAELESLLNDPRHVGRIPVVAGALPPQFILEAAVEALREGIAEDRIVLVSDGQTATETLIVAGWRRPSLLRCRTSATL